ncbi:MAG: hypothetical protein K9N52_09345, partial [Verrucomicrobia bacterium]|nr:hypothetical protein [Verrucomicrobiota bacterium]
MKNFAELLFDLQALEMGPNETKNENAGKISSLREKIPAPVLAHYDRLANRGKKGIALVRNGVCGECHMR